MCTKIWNDPGCDEVLECKPEPGNSIHGIPSTASLLADFIADDGTVLLNVPLESGNSLSNSCEVFGTGLKYFRIDIFNT